jgi:hypothetical protein
MSEELEKNKPTPDVEAHRTREPAPSAEVDKNKVVDEDDTPDVEAHRYTAPVERSK